MTALSSRFLLLINGAVLVGCAVFDYAWRDTLLIALMLMLPFIDRQWPLPRLEPYRYRAAFWSVLIAAMLLLLLANPDHTGLIVYTVLLVALPEEWFFRAYFMQRVEMLSGNRWAANLATSTLFAALHLPVQGWFGLAVFVPSLILGWIYQQRRDLVLVILLHALSNLVYLAYLHGLHGYLAATS